MTRCCRRVQASAGLCGLCERCSLHALPAAGVRRLCGRSCARLQLFYHSMPIVLCSAHKFPRRALVDALATTARPAHTVCIRTGCTSNTLSRRFTAMCASTCTDIYRLFCRCWVTGCHHGVRNVLAHQQPGEDRRLHQLVQCAIRGLESGNDPVHSNVLFTGICLVHCEFDQFVMLTPN